MKKNRFLHKVIVYSISLCIVGAGVTGFSLLKGRSEKEEVRQEQRAARPVMTQEDMEILYAQHRLLQKEEIIEENTSKEEAEEVQQSAYISPIDFEGMWKVNPDVYAWIYIPGTVIDYPILQHATDNTYYLNYNIDGSYGYPGCIYTETMNSKDFTDNHTIIYGHNMKNGTMFSDLHKYKDASFLEENDQIFIYMPQKELEYRIFASYIYDDRHLHYSFNFADEAVYASYLEMVQEMRDMNANLRQDITVTAEDKIITLVTCLNGQPDKRLLVQAVLHTEE
ncbi:MAG: class B sortase [Lachnospiraceae bacterium]|nr:class B sortase [Lachnospiraceae bacterium]